MDNLSAPLTLTSTVSVSALVRSMRNTATMDRSAFHISWGHVRLRQVSFPQMCRFDMLQVCGDECYLHGTGSRGGQRNKNQVSENCFSHRILISFFSKVKQQTNRRNWNLACEAIFRVSDISKSEEEKRKLTIKAKFSRFLDTCITWKPNQKAGEANAAACHFPWGWRGRRELSGRQNKSHRFLPKMYYTGCFIFSRIPPLKSTTKLI